MFLLGVLLLFTGNVGLLWAEYYLPSGLSALLVAIIPVYVAVIEWMMPHGERLRMRGQIGVILGFLGLAILALPSARTGLHGNWHQVIAIAVLLLGALSFACGSIWSRNSKISLDPFVCAGWEMLAASLCDLVVATSLRQWNHAAWNRTSLSVIAFLVVFGSLIGFSCYTWLLHNVPVSKVATYAYVNPMIAVLLGAFLLAERLRVNEWTGMIIILVAVFLVTSSKLRPDPENTEIESVAARAWNLESRPWQRYRAKEENYFLCQRTPPELSSSTIPFSESSLRMASARAKSRALRARFRSSINPSIASELNA